MLWCGCGTGASRGRGGRSLLLHTLSVVEKDAVAHSKNTALALPKALVQRTAGQ